MSTPTLIPETAAEQPEPEVVAAAPERAVEPVQLQNPHGRVRRWAGKRVR